MGELIRLLFENFTITITGLAGGLKDAAVELVFEDPTVDEKKLSVLVQFIFTIAGLSIAMTVFFMIFRLIRFGRQR